MTREEDRKCRVTLELRGFPNYVIDRLLQTGFYGTSKVEVVERVLMGALEEKVREKGYKIGDAKKKGYFREQ